MLALLLGAIALGSGGVYLVNQGPGGVGACPPTILRIVASPDIAPLIRTAAKSTGTARCPAISVAAQEPAATVASMRAHPPDVWVPSSTAWLRLAGSAGAESSDGSDGFPAVGISVARSPLVVAAPRAIAERLGWPGRQPTWTELADQTYARRIPRFSMADPLKATDGLLGVLGVEAAASRADDNIGAATMRTLTFRSRLADAKADPVKLLDKVTGVADPAKDIGLFPVVEQSLWVHLSTSGATSMVALYPPDGLVEADYPVLMSAHVQHDTVRLPLVQRLTDWFRSGVGVHALADRGFRPPSDVGNAAAPGAPGLLAHYGQVAPLPPDPGAVAEAATGWSRYQKLTFQVLLLVDASASMNDPVRDSHGKQTTKAALLRECAADAVRLFGEDTSAGMWMFPTSKATGPPYTEVVPFGSLGDAIGASSRRDVLSSALGRYEASGRVGAPLFDTVLRGQAAMKQMKQHSRPGTITIVFVLTDGRDSGTISRAYFLAHLSADVPVYGLGYGVGADMTALREAARITGGQAIAATNPRDLDTAVAAMFLAAHQREAG